MIKEHYFNINMSHSLFVLFGLLFVSIAVLLLLLLLLILADLTKFIDAGGINLVFVSLVQVHEKHDVVTQTSQAVECRHLDDKCEKIIYHGNSEMRSTTYMWASCSLLPINVLSDLYMSVFQGMWATYKIQARIISMMMYGCPLLLFFLFSLTLLSR